MKVARTGKVLLALAMTAGAAVLVVPGAPVTTVSAFAADCTTAMCGGGEYHPIASPVRIFDSRPTATATGGINDVAPLGRKAVTNIAGTSGQFTVDLLGLGVAPLSTPWLPAGVTHVSDVLAVVANVTVVGSTSNGFLRAFAGTVEPSASLINFLANDAVPNLAILRPDAAGKLTIAMHGAIAGSANVIIDVFGWFSSSTYAPAIAVPPATQDLARGARMIPIDPARIVDTRHGAAADTPIGDASALKVQIQGAVQVGTATVVVPAAASVVGVVLNVTAVKPTAPTHLSVVAADPAATDPVTVPTTSNLNLFPGQVKANLVIAPVDPVTGAVWIYNSAGSTNVAVDVVGYMQTGAVETTRAGRVVPLSTPFRAFDTRSVLFGAVPLGPAQSEDWSFAAFAGSVNIGGVAVGKQSALLGNLTNASLYGVGSSFLAVYPSPGVAANPPTVSNLNSIGNYLGFAIPVPNMALVRYNPANQTVRVFNAAGYANYLLDVSAVVLAD